MTDEIYKTPPNCDNFFGLYIYDHLGLITKLDLTKLEYDGLLVVRGDMYGSMFSQLILF